MKTTLKAIAFAAAALVAPLSASAATLTLDGNTAISVNDDYYDQFTVKAPSGAGSHFYDMTAMSALQIVGQAITLEFTGHFVGLVVALDGAAVSASVTSGSYSQYDLAAVFGAGQTRTLTIDWSSVVASPLATGAAQFNVQIIPSAVPVPAAGLLLVSALGGAAALRRRKATAA